MYQLENSPGRTVIAQGKEYLFFSGYSYLGMGHVPEFVELIKKGMDKYGLLHPSSRISNTQLELYNAFEHRLSVMTGCEDTVSFSSGYLAARAVVETLTKHNRNCFAAPDTHPAIQSGATTLGKHWKKLLIQTINESKDNDFILLSDSVNPLKACVQDFSFLNDLFAEKKLTCIIDDSHGMGYLGANCSGISHLLPVLPNVEYVFTYSLSKALHLNGGTISCTKKVALLLRQSPYYTGSTPLSPAQVYAFLESGKLYAKQQQRLSKNIAAFISYIQDIPGIISHPALPMFILKEHTDQKMFDRHQIIISSFSYPDPAGISINRIVLNALHTDDDLQKIASILRLANI